MGIKSFDGADGVHDGLGLGAAFAIETDDAGAALEHVGGDAWKGLARAASRQRVAGTSQEIAHGHR